MTVSPARIRATTKARAADGLSRYCCVRQMLPFHKSTHKRRFVRGPNKVSKSYGCAAEAWYHVLGEHPIHGKLPQGPQSGTVLVADMSSVYPKVCRVLRELEPGPEVDPAVRYDDELGYSYRGRRMIRMRNGKTIAFVGSEGPQVTLASGENGWLWIDEPPKIGHLGEMLRSLAVKDWAPAWMDFTPVGRPLDALRLYMEGDPERGIAPKGSWDTYVLSLDYDACMAVDWDGTELFPVRTHASIKQQIADCPPGQEPQRLRGEWEGNAEDRAMPAFIEGHSTQPLDAIAETINAIGETAAGRSLRFSLTMDHGQGTGAQACYLNAVMGASAWTLKEWIAPENSTPREVIEGIGEHLIVALGLSWFGLSKMMGDVNSAGFLGAGATLNEILERELVEHLRRSDPAKYRNLQHPPMRFETPQKGRGSVKAGETALNTALKQKQWVIAEECKSLIKSLNYYTGKEEDLKHPIDAVRYDLAPLWGRVQGGSTTLVL